MTTILIAALSFVVGAITGGVALLAFAAPVAKRDAHALRSLEEGLSEQERYAVADHVVGQLKQRDDPWHLNDEARTAPPPMT